VIWLSTSPMVNVFAGSGVALITSFSSPKNFSALNHPKTVDLS
jgi:hypothetical protein